MLNNTKTVYLKLFYCLSGPSYSENNKTINYRNILDLNLKSFVFNTKFDVFFVTFDRFNTLHANLEAVLLACHKCHIW